MASKSEGYEVIQRDLKKKEFAPVYWLFGEETYLRDKALQDLLDGLVPPRERDWALTSLYGADVQFESLVQSVTSQPLGASLSVVVILSFDEIKLQQDQLLQLLTLLPRDSYLILSSQAVDKRTRFYKEVSKLGRVVEFSPVTDEDARKWAGTRLKEQGVSLEPAAFELLMERVRNDLQLAAREIDKLSCYCGREGGTLDQRTVSLLLSGGSGSEEKTIFALVDAVGKKEKKQALTLLRQMLSFGEQPMGIFIMIARQYRLIMGVQRLSRLGYKPADMAKVLGCHPFVVNKVSNQSRLYSPQQLRGIMEMIMEGERKLKESYETQALNLEMFLVRLMQ